MNSGTSSSHSKAMDMLFDQQLHHVAEGVIQLNRHHLPAHAFAHVPAGPVVMKIASAHQVCTRDDPLQTTGVANHHQCADVTLCHHLGGILQGTICAATVDAETFRLNYRNIFHLVILRRKNSLISVFIVPHPSVFFYWLTKEI